MALKNIIQLTSGALAAIFGLFFFFYFGSRQRPHLLETNPELNETAFMHDIGTIAGVLLFGAGCVLLLVGAVAHWSQLSDSEQEGTN